MPNYRRTRIPGGTWFFTAALADRDSTLLVDRINALRAALRVARKARPFRIDAIVVLPEHLHCIWTLPFGDADFSTRWAHVKSVFSHSVEECGPRGRSQVRKRERGFWQRRFWEHLIRDDADYASHLHYLHFNPVKHGWADDPADWPFSSFHYLVARGIYAADWGAAADVPPGRVSVRGSDGMSVGDG